MHGIYFGMRKHLPGQLHQMRAWIKNFAEELLENLAKGKQIINIIPKNRFQARYFTSQQSGLFAATQLQPVWMQSLC